MRWRVIPYGEHGGAWNMALDEAIFQCFVSNSAPPTIRFYGWNSPTATIGRLQPIESVPEGWGREVVRRPTGGRAVLHGEDLTFSLIVPEAALGRPVRESYRRIGSALACALTSVGIQAEFCRNTTPPAAVRGIGECFDLTLEYELAVAGRKVLGSAQLRRSGAVLQQNSLYHDGSCELDDIILSIVSQIEDEFQVECFTAGPLEEELQIARRLADNKYGTDAWNVHPDLRGREADAKEGAGCQS